MGLLGWWPWQCFLLLLLLKLLALELPHLSGFLVQVVILVLGLIKEPILREMLHLSNIKQGKSFYFEKNVHVQFVFL